MTTRRPGGRTARNRAAVLEATLDLLHEHDWTEVNIPLVAQRSGVHAATVYRRWGSMTGLLNDLVAEQVDRLNPIPDTGSLRGDLEQYASQAAQALAGPLGVAMLRAAVLATPMDQQRAPSQAMIERSEQLQRLLDRARARGETPPTEQELLEVVLAPLYFHALFTRPASIDHARVLIDRLERLAEQP